MTRSYHRQGDPRKAKERDKFFTTLSPLWTHQQYKALQKAKSMDDAIKIARAIYAEAYRWVQSYENDFIRFKYDWKVVRQALPLQVRLTVEQVLWNEGPPWRSLCSGFLPVGD